MAVRKTTAAPAAEAITVVNVSVGTMRVCVLGTSPLYYNAMSAKARRELLLPKGRKTVAERAQSIKHDPRSEFIASMYRWSGDDQPTRLKFPAPAFKCLMQTAALETPGAKKAQIGRLTWIGGTHVSIYGRPYLKMDIVRSADIAKTPDVRTRAYLDSWACFVDINYVSPTLNSQVITTLLATGGIVCGIGDFRQERGAGSFGQFALVNENDAQFKHLIESAGREAQDEAIDAAESYDNETAELLDWYDAEIGRRGVAKAA